MPCLLAILGFFFPRVVIVVLFLTGYMGRAFSSLLWPILGFIFAPFTTLAYAWAKNSHGTIDGGYLIVVIIAVLLDLGVIGGGEGQRRKKFGKKHD